MTVVPTADTEVFAKSSFAMSNRARAYSFVAAGHFSLIGISILAFPDTYGGVAYAPLVHYLSLLLWGIAFCVVGLICLIGGISKIPAVARAGLISAFVLLLVSAFAIGWGVVMSWHGDHGPTASALVPISLTALAIKDLLLVGQPLRTPVEDYDSVEDYMRDNTKDYDPIKEK